MNPISTRRAARALAMTAAATTLALTIGTPSHARHDRVGRAETTAAVQPSATVGTAPPDSDQYIDTCLGYVGLVEQLTGERRPAIITARLDQLRKKDLPPSVQSKLAVVVEAGNAVLRGESPALDAPEFVAARQRVDLWMFERCPFPARIAARTTETELAGIPAEVPGGLTVVLFINDARAPRELVLIRKKDGTTESWDELSAMPAAQSASKVEYVDGAITAAPGGWSLIRFRLEPGEYSAVTRAPAAPAGRSAPSTVPSTAEAMTWAMFVVTPQADQPSTPSTPSGPVTVVPSSVAASGPRKGSKQRDLACKAYLGINVLTGSSGEIDVESAQRLIGMLVVSKSSTAVRAELDVIIKAAKAAIDGDRDAFRAPEFLAARAVADAWMFAECEYPNRFTLQVTEHGFAGLPTELSAEADERLPLTILAVNDDTRAHEVLLLRKRPESTTTWAEIVELPLDERFTEEVTVVRHRLLPQQGSKTLLYARLEPGEYAVVCLLTDDSTTDADGSVHDGQGPRHASTGMIATFTVKS